MNYLKSVLFWYTLLFLFTSPCFVACYSLENVSSSSSKVNLSVYYESLCSSCANFIVKDLMTIFNNGLIDIINLKMVPWGNAQVNTINNTTACQNGLDECELNTIQACAINVWHDVNKYYALIYCIEFLAIEGRHQNWVSCFNSLGLPAKPVMECYNNGTGAKLEVSLGYETSHLSPPHTFVPWVLVNNQPLGNNYANFASYICKAYKSNAAPSVCKLALSRIKESKSVLHPVCNTSAAKNVTTSFRLSR